MYSNLKLLAEGVGFEPTELESSAVFKTTALDRSAIPPLSMVADDKPVLVIDLTTDQCDIRSQTWMGCIDLGDSAMASERGFTLRSSLPRHR